MGHDPTVQLLGVTQSSDKPGTTDYQSDPEIFRAGTACRLASDGLLTTTKGSNNTNEWVGISLGKSLADSKQTCVLRAGSRVPILLSSADVIITIGQSVYIDNETGLATDNTVGSTVSNAIYVQGVIDGIDEYGDIVPCAIVDMIGGL